MTNATNSLTLNQRKERLEAHLNARGISLEWIRNNVCIWDGGTASLNDRVSHDESDTFHAPGMYSLYQFFPLQDPNRR